MNQVPSFVAGKRIEPDGSQHIDSIDGRLQLPVATTNPQSLRQAIRFAEESQQRLAAIPLRERIEVAQLVMREYASKSEDAVWALATFRGMTARDSRFTCDQLAQWAEELPGLIEMIGGEGGELTRAVQTRFGRYGKLHWESKGKAIVFSSATMDGPPAVAVLCHAIVSGTHIILRPSWRDAATHFTHEILHAHGLSHYSQLVRWLSDDPLSPQLNRQAFTGMAQSIVFSSNETFTQLINHAAEPGSDAWQEIFRRSRRYGTGLPLAVVTAEADLDAAADELVEASRLGGGRWCLSNAPVLVERAIYSGLLSRVVERARHLRHGDLFEARTDLGLIEREDAAAFRSSLESFGGKIEFGRVAEDTMDLMVLGNVPQESPALFRELPGPIVCLIPIESLDEAPRIAAWALRQNGREAWTAVTTYGSSADYERLRRAVASYRHLKGGVTAKVKLLMPHQGTYFALDLMRRTTTEDSDGPLKGEI